MYPRTMYCQTWDQLYEQFEEATLKRVRQPKSLLGHRDPDEAERLNVEVTRTLHELHHHEQLHRCNG